MQCESIEAFEDLEAEYKLDWSQPVVECAIGKGSDQTVHTHIHINLERARGFYNFFMLN